MCCQSDWEISKSCTWIQYLAPTREAQPSRINLKMQTLLSLKKKKILEDAEKWKSFEFEVYENTNANFTVQRLYEQNKMHWREFHEPNHCLMEIYQKWYFHNNIIIMVVIKIQIAKL